MAATEVDVLVIGAGPSGLAAAIRLKSLGVGPVWVVDREQQAGGVPRHCDHTGFGWRDLRRVMSGPGYARRYIRKAEQSGVEIHTRVTVTEWVGPGQVRVTSPGGIGTIQAGAIVLATGCRERPRAARLVPGSRPAGVFTTGSLQRFAHDFGHPVGERALVVGAEHVSFSAVHTLRQCGVSVAGMVTRHARHQSFQAFIRIAKGLAAFPLYTNSRLTKILGTSRVEAVEITDIPMGQTRLVACDTVVFSGDWIPDRELARKGGVVLDAGTGGPQVDAGLRTTNPGVFAAGNLVHPGETADTAAISGRAAAEAAATYLRKRKWRGEKCIVFDYDREIIQWVSPNALEKGQTTVPHGHFIFRVARVLTNQTLAIRQGDRILWARKFRRLVPNLPYRMPASILVRFDPDGGPLCFTRVPGQP